MIRVRQIKVEVKKDSFEEVRKKTIQKLKIKNQDLKDLTIVKQSIDARDKKNVLYIYEVDCSIVN